MDMENVGSEDELNEAFGKAIFALTSAISAVMRSIGDKEQRMYAIRQLNRPVDEWRKVYDVALNREDYETCDVIKQFIEETEVGR